ncbi:NFX1-type zinc finger-containing protein 1 isoform X2 [Condylostylus longicornis]|uniref:NFX1-type zinc finger-containing protein 1 isoform X2 n=1 Tax=Condylostylus longicornis TaxID=2530218 RepID=UPI00244DEC2F|nr:NFX1-type zinc finger-containing protein 1 isoform X2 [Condylostylus longicornis]
MSDDDWFDKDIDEIVQEVQKKKEPVPASDLSESDFQDLSLLPNRIPNFAAFDDYGGNYELPKKVEEKQVNSNKKHVKTEKGWVQSLSFKKLSFISELTPLNVFLEVTQNDCGFFQCFKENVTNEFIILMIKVMAKLCEQPLEEYKNDFLKTFIESENFLKSLEGVLQGLFDNTIVKNKKSIFQINVQELTEEIILICKNISLAGIANNVIKNFVKNLLEKLNKAGNKFSWSKQKLVDIDRVLNSAPNVIRSKEIYPSLEELNQTGEINCLKPNITEGKYSSVLHYLDVHLSLLREDFISPLRDLIQELRASQNLEEIPSTKIYKKVRLLATDSVYSKNRKGEMILVDLKADQRNGSNINTSPEPTWVNPKKLMFGSLLCFATNLEFNNILLAVVSNRDVDMILKGYIQIEIIKIYDVSKIFETDFIMLESEVYFEPYNHVYKVLKSLDQSNFPLANYIVGIDKTQHYPEYLTGSGKSFYEYRNHFFNPIDYSTYPLAKVLKMDDSQLKAYQHALSNKFSLIQGPPGTGKTYIGLKILTTLLMNIDSQVLIICYTNHALDQFLSRILHVTDDIVRMGNQSKHDLLDKYNIKQMTDTINTDRRLKACFYNAKNEYARKFQEFEQLQRDYNGSDDNYQKILKSQEELKRISKQLDELKQITEYNSIKDKRVIGMTTTYAARCNVLIQLLKTPIVLIEEAAEVLESHIVAALTKNTQHLILIGDHQQLRPTTSVYRLSQKYNMDISLFERMINNRLNCVCLNKQHRMRPEIADLIRGTIYKQLHDHDIVTKYKKINGMAKNMFFITHNSSESKFNDESTKKNVYEAQFLCALANYLLMQDYKPEDIVLLTTYNGQMIQLLNERKQYPSLQKVRVTVVDNFQGEESKIILLSLVRSNEDNRIGYLAMKNRICVALSRAKEGLYAIGNMEFLANNNSTWGNIYQKLREKQAVGENLMLECERHSVTIQINALVDFESVKFGGCQKRCDFQLPCGHTCGYMCHRSQFEHFADCNCVN